MTTEKKAFIPYVTVNNTKLTKVVEIEGAKQEVEVPAKEGFLIETKDLEGNYSKDYFRDTLTGVILFDRYQIKSKFNNSTRYVSNEFEFSGPRNHLKVYSFDEKKDIYEGDYAGAVEHFATGKMTDYDKPEKTFDVFNILYVLVDGEVLRFSWKMNKGNNWFEYKDNNKVDKKSREDNKDYRGVSTDFKIESKKVGKNTFWACTLVKVGDVDRAEADRVGDALIEMQDNGTTKKEVTKEEALPTINVDDEIDSDEINVENIPF